MRCCENCYNGHYNLSERGEELVCDNNEFQEEYVREEHVCDCHRFISGMENEKNYLFYDENYIAPGYLIIHKVDNEITKFFKIYITNNNGFPSFSVSAFSIESKDKPEQEFNTITFDFRDIEDDTNGLYKVFTDLCYKLSSKKIFSIDKILHGSNNFSLEENGNITSIIFCKDVWNGRQHPTDFASVDVGDNYICEEYEIISKFYKDLSLLPATKLEESDIKKMLLIRK